MAVCERGYLCEVCGDDVAEIHESDLYLRFVLGEVDPETLHVQPERHLACNPTLAQFIVAEDFPAVHVEGPFAKSELDPEFVAAEEARVTRGYLRLRALLELDLPLTEYPLPEVRARWQGPPAGPAGAGDVPAQGEGGGSSRTEAAPAASPTPGASG